MRHYDVVVLGRSLGALTLAALLARRDFSVLLLGQEQRPYSYQFERFRLKRRSFSLLFGASPVWRRVLHELAQSPSFRRKTHALEPMFSMCAPGRRLQVSARPEVFEREVEREFSEVKQLVDEFYAQLATANAAIDAAFSRDMVWPPESFWDRFGAARVASSLPYLDNDEAGDLLGKFPLDHPYRELATLPAVFASDLDYAVMGLPGLALARLHGFWTRGLDALTRGGDELDDFLLERFQAHGGIVELSRKAESLVVRGGRIVGVVEDGASDAIGADAVVTCLSGEAIAQLARGDGITNQAKERWPQVTASAGRFVVSVVVKSSGVPSPLPAETFLLPPDSPYPDPRQPVVHLQRIDASGLGPDANPDETLLVAEAIIPAEGALTLHEARSSVMNTLDLHFPFLRKHIVLLDSPHDGLPLEDYSQGTRREIDRIHVLQSSPKPEYMEHQWSVEPTGYLGLAAEPCVGPIPGSYLVGKTTLPALGQEGELLAAWSVAKMLTRKDSVRQRRRRQLWTKIETG
ncbi:MAG TPA: phytoene dehydrogenase [Polyangiaceae bacterium]|jgi:phytoene dehydrogenase-like protein|nr:phytoene dehydrogenase [Polyangiaceae bacterium]